MKAGYILVYEGKVLVKYAEENSWTHAEFDKTAKGLAEAARVLGRWMELEEESNHLGLDQPQASPQCTLLVKNIGKQWADIQTEKEDGRR